MSTSKLTGKNTPCTPEFTVKLKNAICSEGQPVTLECCVKGYPAPEVTWEKGGQVIGTTRCIRTERQGERCKLTIKSFSKTETGTYKCMATNKFGTAFTISTLKIEGNAISTPPSNESQLNKNKTVPDKINKFIFPKLKPVVKTPPDYVRTDSKKLHFSIRKSPPKQTNGDVTPPTLKPQTAAHNRKGAQLCTVEKVSFRKRDKAPTFIMPPHSKVVDEGDSVRFICSVSGVPEPTVKWERSDVTTNDNDKPCPRFKFSQNECIHMFDIENVKVKDSGHYVAMVTNSVGKTSASLDLEVRAKKPKSSPPVVIRPLEDFAIDDGQLCLLSCEVSGFPAPTITWLKDEEVFKAHQDADVTFDGQTAALTITEVYPEDEGFYTCRIENDLGQVETSCRVIVNEKQRPGEKPQFVQALKDLEEVDGSPVTLSVQVKGSQPMEVIWVHNENEIQNCPEFQYVTSDDGATHSLVIEELFPEDAGLYSCEVYNKFGENECSCTLTVLDRTEITPTNTKPRTPLPPSTTTTTTTLDTNQDDTLSSSGKESPVPKSPVFRRSKSNDTRAAAGQVFVEKRELTLVTPMENSSSRRRNSLISGSASPIPEILVTDASVPFPMTTRVLSPPRLTPAQVLKGPQSISILRGQNITLRTHFIGSPPPTITWIKGGKILKENDRIAIEIHEGLTVLIIKNATSDDSGKYVVTVENSGGSDCLFASVSVEGPPDPPSEKPVVSDVTSHSAIVCWSGSPYDGGSIITGYIVEKCSLPEMRWTQVSRACHTTSYHVRDLLPERRYVFRVKAENVHGLSAPSPESDSVFTVDNDDNDSVIMDSQVVEIEKDVPFSDRYSLAEVIGKGRFGIVYCCHEKRTGLQRAAKVIRCVKSKDKLKVREEVEVMNRLKHPKLLQLYGAYEGPKEVTLVMEYVTGGELFERIVADDFVLLERDCVLFMQQICEAVKYMNDSGVIHLDLKPENILCESKTSHHIKIIDFGLAKLFKPDESIRVLFGTPEFVAPEVISYEPVGTYSDMWSVGVICYVLLTGLSPFMGDSDAETFANITRVDYDFDDEAFDAVSEDAKDFISKLFIRRPEKRLTPSEALKHKWLAKEQNRMSSVQLSTDKLKKFIIRRKWQKTGNAIRAIGRMVNLSGVSTSRSPLSTQGSLSDSDYSSNSPFSSIQSVGSHSIIPEMKNDENSSVESGMGDTDSVDSEMSETKVN